MDKPFGHENSQRFKFPKTVLFGITALHRFDAGYLFSFFKEPIIVCAQRMLTAQGLALMFQVAPNYINYHSQNKIVILATLFVSAGLLGRLPVFQPLV